MMKQSKNFEIVKTVRKSSSKVLDLLFWKKIPNKYIETRGRLRPEDFLPMSTIESVCRGIREHGMEEYMRMMRDFKL